MAAFDFLPDRVLSLIRLVKSIFHIFLDTADWTWLRYAPGKSGPSLVYADTHRDDECV